jgi:hypothetical protein
MVGPQVTSAVILAVGRSREPRCRPDNRLSPRFAGTAPTPAIPRRQDVALTTDCLRGWPIVSHPGPTLSPAATAMLSLDNVFSEADLPAWASRVVRNLPVGATPRWVCELKFDGTAVHLVYRGRRFRRWGDRGDWRDDQPATGCHS